MDYTILPAQASFFLKAKLAGYSEEELGLCTDLYNVGHIWAFLYLL